MNYSECESECENEGGHQWFPWEYSEMNLRDTKTGQIVGRAINGKRCGRCGYRCATFVPAEPKEASRE